MITTTARIRSAFSLHKTGSLTVSCMFEIPKISTIGEIIIMNFYYLGKLKVSELLASLIFEKDIYHLLINYSQKDVIRQTCDHYCLK